MRRQVQRHNQKPISNVHLWYVHVRKTLIQTPFQSIDKYVISIDFLTSYGHGVAAKTCCLQTTNTPGYMTRIIETHRHAAVAGIKNNRAEYSG